MESVQVHSAVFLEGGLKFLQSLLDLHCNKENRRMHRSMGCIKLSSQISVMMLALFVGMRLLSFVCCWHCCDSAQFRGKFTAESEEHCAIMGLWQKTGLHGHNLV